MAPRKDQQRQAAADQRHRVDDPDRDRLAAALHDEACGWNCPGHGIMQPVVDRKYGRLADTALRTLAGRLLPSGGEVSTQWGWRRRKPDGTWTSVLEAINETEARDAIANPTHAWRDGSQSMKRTVHKWDSGGWLPGEWEVAETVWPALSDSSEVPNGD